MPSIIKVAIVESDGEFLECLRNLFDNSPGFVCDGAFGTLEPAVEKLGNSQPDVVLLDFDLPEDLSISGLRQIKATLPRVRIIMFTNSPNYDRIVESLRSGACGYLLKSDSSAELLKVIYELHEEKASPIGWAKVTPPSLSAHDHPTSRLSVEEQLILKFINQGFRYQEIATRLGISVEAVRNQAKEIYRKYNVFCKRDALFKLPRF